MTIIYLPRCLNLRLSLPPRKYRVTLGLLANYDHFPFIAFYLTYLFCSVYLTFVTCIFFLFAFIVVFILFYLFCVSRLLFLQNRSRQRRDPLDNHYVLLTKTATPLPRYSSPQAAFARKTEPRFSVPWE